MRIAKAAGWALHGLLAAGCRRTVTLPSRRRSPRHQRRWLSALNEGRAGIELCARVHRPQSACRRTLTSTPSCC